MNPKPDILPTKSCSTDTAGEKVEKLASPLLTHFFLLLLLKAAWHFSRSEFSLQLFLKGRVILQSPQIKSLDPGESFRLNPFHWQKLNESGSPALSGSPPAWSFSPALVFPELPLPWEPPNPSHSLHCCDVLLMGTELSTRKLFVYKRRRRKFTL